MDAQQESSPRKIAVVGGGISGLAAAHRLFELDATCEVKLFEASDRLGGVLRTEREDGFLIERSADMFTTKDPWAVDLCRRIGFEDQLIETDATNRRSFIVRRGRLVATPSGFTLMSPSRIWPMVTTPLLSLRGKLRLACEYFIRAKKSDDDESLASFTRRRMGREVYERIVQPMIGGIYTADPERLSMQATMRQFVEMEQEHGSLIRGLRHREKRGSTKSDASGARYGMFVAPREGMTSLVDAIAGRLPAGCVKFQTPVTSIRREQQDWEVETNAGRERFDAVILATPGPLTAPLVRPLSPSLASELAAIPYASAVVVVSAIKRGDVQHPLNGFGFVVPAIERRKILACSFASVKFAGRAPDDSVLTRTFVGGGTQPELAELPDVQLLDLVKDELRELIGLRGEPTVSRVVRWRESMPQYHVGHLDLVERIEKLVADLPGLELAGNACRGVGIPFCIQSGEQAVERLLAKTTGN